MSFLSDFKFKLLAFNYKYIFLNIFLISNGKRISLRFRKGASGDHYPKEQPQKKTLKEKGLPQ